MRTGLYLGHSAPEYGPDKDQFGVTAPEWCAMTMFRRAGVGERIEFPVRVYFREAVALKDGKANDRWAKAPFQMLTKSTEAAGLREAFPDEFGGEQTAEEMDDQAPIDVTPAAPVLPAQRLSQAPPVVEPGLEPAPAATAPPDAPAHIGQIAEVQPKGDAAAMVVLSTGFKASTRDGEVIKAAAHLRDTKALVELVTKPSSDPSKFAASIIEIVIIEGGEVAAS
jgi:hypothetical protein